VNRYIDAHRADYGVEPICEVLQVAPSTYYAARKRLPCRRRVRDDDLKAHIARVFDDNYGVYGARKVWRALNRDGVDVARCTTERLMRQMGLAGRVRGRKRRTTIPAHVSPRPADLVERQFRAQRPNQLWIADITYVATWSGFAYAAFVTDVFSRRIVGWRVSTTLRADLALDALEMAIWTRQSENLDGLVHHSDRGVQYLSIVYTERLAEEGAVVSVGSRGDSYDNAMAESIIGLYKCELIHNERQGPWRTVEDVELATLGWVHWWNTSRLLEPIGNVPPAEFEANWRDERENRPTGALLSAANDRGGINTPGETESATDSSGS
jgi:putative transposase